MLKQLIKHKLLQFRPVLSRSFFVISVSLGIFLFLGASHPINAAVNNTINYQSKIVIKSSGLNITSGSPACVKSGADTCDFQVRIWDDATATSTTSGSGNLLFTQTFQDVEIGSTNGIFNLNINSCGSTTSGTSQWGTTTGTCTAVDDGGDADSDPGVNFNRSDLYIEIGFAPSDTSGSLGSFTELFTRTQLKSVPSAIFAGNAAAVGGLSTTDLVQFATGTAQTTSSTNGLINLTTTGNTSSTLLFVNENGAGTPSLLDLQVAGTSKFKVDNTGQVTINGSTNTTGVLTVNGTYNTSSGGNTAFVMNSTQTAASTGSIDTLDLNSYFSGSGTLAGMNGVLIRPQSTGTGTITTATGVATWGQVNSGATITNLENLAVLNAVNSGTLNSQFGLYINNLTSGSSDYGIYVAGADTYAVWVDSGTTRLDGTLNLSSLTNNKGILYTDGSGNVSQVATPSSNQCLQTDGSSSLTWGACGASGTYVNLNPSSTQSTSSTNSLIDLTATGNVTNSLIKVNENGAGTPMLLELQTASSDVFTINNSGNINTIGGAAHTIANNAGALNIDSASTGAINLGTGANGKIITIGNNTAATALNFISGTGSQSFTSSATTNDGFVYTANSLTSGNGVVIQSSSSSGTGDLVRINSTGLVGNLLNVLSNSSTVFAVSQTQITANLPTQFTAPGDISVAYDLQFTNQTSSFIKSYGPLTVESGENFESNNLTLKTYNSGSLVFVNGSTVMSQFTSAGQLQLPTAGSTGGLLLGGDATLYRSAANELTTTGALVINTTSTSKLLSLTSTATSSSNALIFANENGTGTPNLLQLQTASSDVFLVNNSGGIGVGGAIATNSSSSFTNNKSSMTLGAYYYGIYNDQTFSGANATGGGEAFISLANAAPGTSNTLYASYGVVALARLTTAGTLANAFSNYGRADNTSSGTITNAFALYGSAPVNSGGGSIGSAYGLYIENQTVATTNNFGIYIGGASGGSTNNYALFVNSGDTKFQGDLSSNSLISNNAYSNTDGATTQTITVSNAGYVFDLQKNTGTTNTATTTTYNLTGVNDTNGSVLFIHTKVIKGSTGSSRVETIIVQVNGVQISTVATSSTSSAATVIESYTAVKMNGTWVIMGNSTSDTADVAEYIPGSADLKPGEILSSDPNQSEAVVRSTTKYQKDIMGVYSTAPFIINSTDQGNIPLALAGRVPVFVSNINGDIQIGEAITSSNIPGYGMKANRAGQIVGRALEASGYKLTNADCPVGDQNVLDIHGDPIKCGQILVYLEVGYDAYPNLGQDPSAGLTLTADTEVGKFKLVDQDNEKVADNMSLNDLMVANVQAGSIKANTLNATTINIMDQSLDQYIRQVVRSSQSSATSSSSASANEGQVAGAQTTGNDIYASSVNMPNYDVAEEYSVEDTTITGGDVVQLKVIQSDPNTQIDDIAASELDSNTVEKTNLKYSVDVIGVVSSNPAAYISDWASQDDKEHHRAVAMQGRVPVNATTENGAIRRGDYLTTGHIPGTVMKATHAGQIVGIAMQDLDIDNTTADVTKGQVMIYLKPGYISQAAYNAKDDLANGVDIAQIGDVNIDSLFKLVDGGITTSANIQTSGSVVASTFSAVSNKDLILQMSNTAIFKLVDQNGVQIFAVNSNGKINLYEGKNGSTGKSMIPAGSTEVMVTNTSITDNSRINLTPDQFVQYRIKNKTAGVGFTIEITNAIDQDTNFDYLIIN